MDTTSRFWDRIADSYARRPVADEAAYQKKLEITRGHLRPDMRVLEIGCGTGSTAIAHAPWVKHIRAVDVSRKMIDIARDRAAASHVDNVSFEQGAIDDLEVPERSLDAVLGLSILHLIDDRETVIARVHRMLVPGGLFITNTACLGDSWLKLIGLVAPIGRLLGVLPLIRVFTRKKLEDSLKAAGFEIEHLWQPGKTKAVFIVARKP